MQQQQPAAGSSAAGPRELPDLCRLCVLADGRTKALFSDNTLVLLTSGGSAFTVVAPDGRQTRQLSEYALTRHSPLVAAALEFRNMHLEQPYFCRPLARSLKTGFSLGYAVRDATWPASGHDALERGLVQAHPDGKVAVASEDGTAQVVLHFHRRRFAVCYPLLVDERPQEAKFEYVWHTQVFSLASHPPRWAPAARVALEAANALAAAGAADGQQEQLMMAQPGGQLPPQSWSGQGGGVAEAPEVLAPPAPPAEGESSSSGRAAGQADGATAGGSAQQPPGQQLVPGEAAASSDCAPLGPRTSPLPEASERSAAGLREPFPPDSWWQEASLSMPPGDVVVLEWTPQATYQYLPDRGKAEVWVHQDESCLVSTRGGRFWAHYKDPGAAEQLYAASCVPDYVWSRDGEARYAIGQLAAHAMKLREHNVAAASGSAIRGQAPLNNRAGGLALVSNPNDVLFAASSTAVLEDCSVAGQGRFTAYDDGRVRVCFGDRTILQLSADHAHAKAILPDGGAAVVSVSNPVGIEGYVRVALDFCAWAFKTPAERSDALRMQARVQVELAAAQRMAHVCEHGLTQAVPTAVAQQLLGLGTPEKRLEDSSAVQLQAGAARPTQGMGSGGVPDRERMIEELLHRNAMMLQRLSG